MLRPSSRFPSSYSHAFSFSVTVCPVGNMVGFDDFVVVDPNAPVDDNDLTDVLSGPVTIPPGENGEEPSLQVTFAGDEPASVITFEVTVDKVEEVTVTLEDENGDPLYSEKVSKPRCTCSRSTPFSTTTRLLARLIADLRTVSHFFLPLAFRFLWTKLQPPSN